MPTVTKAASSEVDGTTAGGTDLGRWANPSNAFALTGDNVYATAVLGTSKNTGRASRFGFPAFTTSDIPDGSTINSVTVTVEWDYTVQVVGSTLGVQLHNPGGTALGTETTKTATGEEQHTQQVTAGIALADLRTAGTVVANIRFQKGNNATDTTGRLDFVTLTVDYTPPAEYTDSATVYFDLQASGIEWSDYQTEVLLDLPYFYWPIDEASGTVAEDATANNRDGTYTNSPTLSQDSLLPALPDGKSVSFGSGTDHIGSTFLLNTSNISIETWILIDALPGVGDRAVIVGFSEGYGSATHDKNLYVDENGKPGFYVFDGAAKHTSLAVDALSLATVYHVVGVCNGTTSKCYVNGVEVGSIAASGSFTGYAANNVFAPSDPSAAGWVKFQGHLDEIAVYDHALSPERVLIHYLAGIEEVAPAVQPVGGVVMSQSDFSNVARQSHWMAHRIH